MLFIFICVKYYIFGSRGYRSVPQNNEQPFKSPMSSLIQKRQNVKM